jgi:glc operon protein GlcG
LAALSTGTPCKASAGAQSKAFTAARQRQATGALAEDFKANESSFAYYGDPRYIDGDDGTPIIADGNVIAVIAVSGVTEREDVQLARIGRDPLYNRLSLKMDASK